MDQANTGESQVSDNSSRPTLYAVKRKDLVTKVLQSRDGNNISYGA